MCVAGRIKRPQGSELTPTLLTGPAGTQPILSQSRANYQPAGLFCDTPDCGLHASQTDRFMLKSIYTRPSTRTNNNKIRY